MVTQSEKLYKERLVLKDNIKKVWQFLNSMRNKPEEVKIQVEKLKIEFKKFENFVSEINEEVDMSFKNSGGVGSGVVAGVVLRLLVLLRLWLLQQHLVRFYGYCNFNIKWRCN